MYDFEETYAFPVTSKQDGIEKKENFRSAF